MAIEGKRGCGYRKVGGLYLVGGALDFPCDRLPYPLSICPVCGHGTKIGRGYTRINPFKLFGNHDKEAAISNDSSVTIPVCQDVIRPCIMCDPPDDTAYIMLVGDKFYTPESFLKEAQEMGVSKRVAFIPQEFEMGKTIIYLIIRRVLKAVMATPKMKMVLSVCFRSTLVSSLPLSPERLKNSSGSRS